MFPDEIRTERLRLVRLCRENVPTETLYRHMRAGAPHMAEVSKYAMWEPHETPKDTHDYLEEVETEWDEREQATYALFPREGERRQRTDGGASRYETVESRQNGTIGDAAHRDASVDAERLAGTTNLDIDWDRRSAEMGIWLRKPFWGRGYSGERAEALLGLAFDCLGLEQVVAAHPDGNEKSRRAIEKYVERFGGQYDGVLRDFVSTDDGERDLHRYTISREQYRDATR